MKTKILSLFILTILLACGNSVEYSEDFKKQTSGKYLYNADDVIDVYYEGNKLFLNWRGGRMEPVSLTENEFLVADMYKKLRFVTHPETKERYLSIVDENDEEKITYDYPKVAEDYKTPSQLLNDGEYEKALAGFMKIKEKDSTSIFINEREFNMIGYDHLRAKEYDKAIGVFKLNVALHPNSDNVYDSLADAYLRSGDSLQAYNNYKIAYGKNPNNPRAEKYVKAYESSKRVE